MDSHHAGAISAQLCCVGYRAGAAGDSREAGCAEGWCPQPSGLGLGSELAPGRPACILLPGCAHVEMQAPGSEGCLRTRPATQPCCPSTWHLLLRLALGRGHRVASC